ncbi:MAG: GNAT family N-acetyltransferase [Leptolyngbya sp. SIOISBB]|nr:GNAT family N-acetyltransferase [Leptolyngbya sp. SIOISBB]
MTVHYALATANDLPTLLALLQEFYALEELHFDPKQAPQTLLTFLENQHFGRLWLISVDAEVAGYVALTFGYSLEYGGVDAFVDEIYLRPAFRHQGVGTQTLMFVEAQSRELEVKALHLEVLADNEKAYDLYKRLGYQDRASRLLHKRLMD